MANGSYDITFHFAEPADIGRGERIFSAFAEGLPVIENIDVMLWRDGKVRSALTVTVPGIVVEDGALDIRFEADKREPILSALVVRERTARDESGELVWSDEFDEDGAPNADHWNVEVWAAGAGCTPWGKPIFFTAVSKSGPGCQRGRERGPQSGCCRAAHLPMRRRVLTMKTGRAAKNVTRGRIPARSTSWNTSVTR
jgi:hypothetical protein